MAVPDGEFKNGWPQAEGFEGLAEIEEELEKLLRRGSIRGSQGMLLRQRLDERRYALDEELRVSQQAQWWAAMGQQNQQGGGWYPTSEQAQWYAEVTRVQNRFLFAYQK